jgi:hypothetical protein
MNQLKGKYSKCKGLNADRNMARWPMPPRAIWSAVAKRSGDTAFERPQTSAAPVARLENHGFFVHMSYCVSGHTSAN